MLKSLIERDCYSLQAFLIELISRYLESDFKNTIMKDQQALSQLLNKDFELEGTLTKDELRNKLIHAFSWMLDNDISKMMQILYRADVDEDRLKSLLISSSHLPSAEVIADEYLNRQRRKIETRKLYST